MPAFPKRRAGQGHTDHHGHRTGHNGRQDPVQGRLADAHDQEADGNFEYCRQEDAHLGDTHAICAIELGRVIEAGRCELAHDRDDDGDVGERRAVIHRDLAPGDQQGHDGAQAGGQQRHPHVELGQRRHQYRGREHGQELLEAQAQHCSDGWGVIRQEADDLGFGLYFCRHSLLLWDLGCFLIRRWIKKESRKNGSPKKQNHWALPPGCTEGSKNNRCSDIGGNFTWRWNSVKVFISNFHEDNRSSFQPALC